MNWSEIYSQIIRFIPRWEILNPDEVGVHIRFGKLKRELGPGVCFCLPYFDEVFKFTSVSQVATIHHQSVKSRDNKVIAVTCSVTFSVIDPEQAILKVGDLYEQIRCYIGGLISHYINQNMYDEINVDGLTEYILSESELYLAEDIGVHMESVSVLDLAQHKIIRLMSGTHLETEG